MIPLYNVSELHTMLHTYELKVIDIMIMIIVIVITIIVIIIIIIITTITTTITTIITIITTIMIIIRREYGYAFRCFFNTDWCWGINILFSCKALSCIAHICHIKWDSDSIAIDTMDVVTPELWLTHGTTNYWWRYCVVNSIRPEHNDRHLADDISNTFYCFLTEHWFR